MWLVRLLATALQGGDVWHADAHQRGVPAGGGADAWFAAGIGRKDGGDCLHVVFGLLLSSTSRTTAPHLMRGVLVHIMEIIPESFVLFFCISSSSCVCLLVTGVQGNRRWRTASHPC